MSHKAPLRSRPLVFRRASRAVLVVVALVLAATMLPVQTVSATPESSAVIGTLALDGSLPYLDAGTIADGSEVVLGDIQTIGATGEPVVLGQATSSGCTTGFLAFVECLGETVISGVSCTAGAVLDPFAVWESIQDGPCQEFIADVWKPVAGIGQWVLNRAIEGMFMDLYAVTKAMASTLSDYVIVNLLGSGSAGVTPVVDCSTATGTGAENCGMRGSSWFSDSYASVRTIAMLLVIPLFLAMVIQSIIRGSMYLLVRSMFIMVPAAVILSVFAVSFEQLLLNITGDITVALASQGAAADDYGNRMKGTIDGLDVATMSLFHALWLVFFVIALFLIFIQMVIREAGVYLAALFLPLGFAGLVWPSTSRFATSLFKKVIGFTIAPIFITAALTLGMYAVADVGGAADSGGDENDNNGADIAGGAAALMFAGYSGKKVLDVVDLGSDAIVRQAGMLQGAQMMALAGQKGAAFLDKRAHVDGKKSFDHSSREKKPPQSQGPPPLPSGPDQGGKDGGGGAPPPPLPQKGDVERGLREAENFANNPTEGPNGKGGSGAPPPLSDGKKGIDKMLWDVEQHNKNHANSNPSTPGSKPASPPATSNPPTPNPPKPTSVKPNSALPGSTKPSPGGDSKP